MLNMEEWIKREPTDEEYKRHDGNFLGAVIFANGAGGFRIAIDTIRRDALNKYWKVRSDIIIVGWQNLPDLPEVRL